MLRFALERCVWSTFSPIIEQIRLIALRCGWSEIETTFVAPYNPCTFLDSWNLHGLLGDSIKNISVFNSFYKPAERPLLELRKGLPVS